MVTDYTTYGAIRAALGVSIEELTDEVLAEEIYLFDLLREMRGISATLEADYDTVAAKLEGDRTVNEQTFYEAVRLFSSYAVARQCLNTLPMFSPKTISSGKTLTTRYSDSPYRHTVDSVRASYVKFRKNLEDAYAAFNETTAASTYTHSLLISSSPDTDPVTGT